jgi:hypothetical protein
MANKRRNAISGQFVARLTEMQQSPAFRILSLSALRALARLEIELAHHAGTNNGKLAVTFKDFEKYGIRRHSIGPALDELDALGFATITQRGKKAVTAEYRRPTLFLLTTRPELEGVGPERCRWRRFKTIEAAETARAARRKRPEKSRASPSRNLKTASAETAPLPVPKRHRKRENASAETAPIRPAETAPLSISRVGTGTRTTTDDRPDAPQPIRLAHDADRPTPVRADDGARLPFPTPAKG